MPSYQECFPARGAIRNRANGEQGKDFTGLRIGTITPTDIDAFIDYQNRLFIFIEAKFIGAEMPFGQRLAYERLCDASVSETRWAVVLVALHQVPVDEQIDFAICEVGQYYFRGRWRKPSQRMTIREAVDIFVARLVPTETLQGPAVQMSFSY